METKTSWWKLTIEDYPNYKPNDVDLEHIAELIKQGYDQGELIQETENDETNDQLKFLLLSHGFIFNDSINNNNMNKQLTQKQNLDELMKQTLLNILSAKGIIYTYYKNNKLTQGNYDISKT